MADAVQEPWTIGRCLNWTTDYFERLGVPQPRLSAEWLLMDATGFDQKIQLLMKHDLPLEKDELARIRHGIERRVEGEPLQYITGDTQFRKLNILCEPGVLIPRPETELLVEYVLEYLDRNVTGWVKPKPERVSLPWNAEVEALRQAEEAARAALGQAEAGDDEEAASHEGEPASPEDAAASPEECVDVDEGDASQSEAECGAPHRQARVIEIGCGTGCISLSLAAERPGCVSCVATDISPAAIDLAQRNRARCGISPEVVDLRLGDLTGPVRPEERASFDVLVSNPPYIPTSVLEAIPHEVRDFEPLLALDGGEDGLAIFRRLVSAAPYTLKQDGLLACELHEDALEEAANICINAGMHDVEILQDLTGRPRYVFAHTG